MPNQSSKSSQRPRESLTSETMGRSNNNGRSSDSRSQQHRTTRRNSSGEIVEARLASLTADDEDDQRTRNFFQRCNQSREVSLAATNKFLARTQEVRAQMGDLLSDVDSEEDLQQWLREHQDEMLSRLLQPAAASPAAAP